LSRRQQLVKGNEHHDAGYHGKQGAEHKFVEKLKEDGVSDNGAQRL
jgi:hypothetical protein